MHIGPINILHGSSISWWMSFLLPIFAAILAVLGGVFGEWIRRKIFRPKLIFNEKDPYKTSIQPATIDVDNDFNPSHYYLKVPVSNSSLTTAKDCRAYLTGIVSHESDQKKTSIILDTLRVSWAFEGIGDGGSGDLHRGIDLPPGVVVHFDILSLRKPKENGHNGIRIEYAAKKLRESPMFVNKLIPNSRYRFEVMVTCDGGTPIRKSINVRLGNDWKEIEVLT